MPVHAQSSANPELNASFTSQIITIDGKMEDAWKKSLPAPIAIPAQAGNATVAGTTGGSFRALWDGAKLYLLIGVKDAEIYNTASRIFEKDGDTARFDSSAVGLLHDKDGKQAGYLVEAAIHIGGLLQRNGTRIGLEIAINDIDRATNKQDESYLQSALMQAKKSLSLQSQKERDKANSTLSKAIKRSGSLSSIMNMDRCRAARKNWLPLCREKN